MIGTFHDDNMNKTALTYIKLHVFESLPQIPNQFYAYINGPKKKNEQQNNNKILQN